MARYRLNAAAYLKDGYYPAGAEVELPDDFPVGPHLEPARDAQGNEDGAARAALDKYNGDENRKPVPGDPAFIGNMIAHTLSSGETNGPVRVNSPAVTVDENGVARGVTAPIAQPMTGMVSDAPGGGAVPITPLPTPAEAKAQAGEAGADGDTAVPPGSVALLAPAEQAEPDTSRRRKS